MERDLFYTLLADYFSGNISSEDENKLYALIQKKPELKVEFDLLKEHRLFAPMTKELLNDQYEKFKSALVTENDVVSISDSNYSNERRFNWFAAASIAILIIIVTGIFFLKKNKENPTFAMVQNMGAPKKTILPDGSVLILSSNSHISWDSSKFNKEKREVSLEGECYFDVASNKHVPFIVHTKLGDIRVLGTAFNVKAYGSTKLETVLLRGAIAFSSNNEKTIILKPNEKISINENNQKDLNQAHVTVNHIDEKTITVDTSWLQKTFNWNDKPLDEVAIDLENFYKVKINIQNNAVKNYRFTGSISNESIDVVMKTLSKVRPFDYNIDNQKNITIF